eukprot:scaffold118117_cov51-Phaeocystis_antarctica.AAC.1
MNQPKVVPIKASRIGFHVFALSMYPESPDAQPPRRRATGPSRAEHWRSSGGFGLDIHDIGAAVPTTRWPAAQGAAAHSRNDHSKYVRGIVREVPIVRVREVPTSACPKRTTQVWCPSTASPATVASPAAKLVGALPPAEVGCLSVSWRCLPRCAAAAAAAAAACPDDGEVAAATPALRGQARGGRLPGVLTVRAVGRALAQPIRAEWVRLGIELTNHSVAAASIIVALADSNGPR